MAILGIGDDLGIFMAIGNPWYPGDLLGRVEDARYAYSYDMRLAQVLGLQRTWTDWSQAP